MLSQLRGTRYTLVAIVMAAGLMFAAPRSSHALMVEFTITVEDVGNAPGFPVGTLMGQFTGEDNNPTDNMINIGELTDLQVEWTPSAVGMALGAPDSFALGFDDRQRFSYDAMTSPPTIDELYLASAFALVCGPNQSTFTSCTVGQSVFLFVSDPGNVYTITGVRIGPVQTAIPEPSTWLLLGTGLVGLMGYAFSRRMRPATTRRAPVAGA